MGAGAVLEGLNRMHRRVLRRLLREGKCRMHALDIDATQIVAEKQSAQWTYKSEKGYMPISIALTDIRCGDQWKALKYLYGLLIHTCATDMTSEGLNAAQHWGWRENSQIMPHSEFSSKYLSMLRNMLAYAGQDGALHLANVWSPVWAKSGRCIAFKGNTGFGHIAYTIHLRSGGAFMHLNPPTRSTPKSIIVSVPENDGVTDVTAGGHSIGTFKGDQITLPALTHPTTIKISWKQKKVAPPYSFARTVKDYLANYHKMTSPPDVRVKNVAVAHPTVRAGDPLQVKGSVTNTGGAGYLNDSRISLYVDGEPAQTDKRALATGIGFTILKEIISFDHKSEGVVPIGFTIKLCDPGKHTLGVALGTHQTTRTLTIGVLPPRSVLKAKSY